MAEPRMTPSAILARLRRGFGRIRRTVREAVIRLTGQARGYRYAEERAHHEDELRQRQISLALMASADPADAQQVRMATDIEHGAEERLGVLLNKARLSVAEKRERDAIQAALQARRQGFDAPAGWVSRPRAAVAGFLGPLAAVGGLRLWMVFAGLFAFAGGATAIQTARLNHAKGDLREVRADLAMTERALTEARATAQELARAVQAADALSHQTAANLQAERDRRARAAAIERRRQREIQDVLTGRDPPAWRLRDDEPGQGAGTGGPAVGDPG